MFPNRKWLKFDKNPYVFGFLLSVFLFGCATIHIGPSLGELREETVEGKGPGKILLVDIDGIINNQKDRTLTGNTLHLGMVEKIRSVIEKAEKDKEIKALLVKVNSPGGTVTASDIIFHLFKKYKERTKVKIYVQVMDLAASGGYYIAISGDEKRFLERTAKIQVGLLICVYSLSYAPAILNLQLYEYQDDQLLWKGSKAGLLFYFVLLVQLGDIFQYSWGKLVGRRVIAPKINSSRTWEGLIGGVATTAMIAAALFSVTPFGPLEAACMGAVVAIMGFAGGMTMSAIKRDRGVKDYGTLVQGHAGVLDRIDSLCFAAPVFFHFAIHRPFLWG